MCIIFNVFFFSQIARTQTQNCLDLLNKQNCQVFLSAVEQRDTVTVLLKEL